MIVMVKGDQGHDCPVLLGVQGEGGYGYAVIVGMELGQGQDCSASPGVLGGGGLVQDDHQVGAAQYF